MANYPGFCGQTYASPSFQLDAECARNLFPEVIDIPGVTARSRIVLRRRPGYKLLQTLPDTPGRGDCTVQGRVFAVAGSTLFELLSKTTYVARGTVAAGSDPVQFVATQTQLLILAGGNGYILTLASNAFAQITATGWPAPVSSVATIDTYFIALGPTGTNKFSISGLLDGLSWSALDFGSSQEPDDAVAIAGSHLYLWIFGTQDTILFQDSGVASFPFSRVPGTEIMQGCAAVGSVATLDNTAYWLGANEDGQGVVYRADGLLPSRISTHPVETAIQSYSTISDAVASTYQKNGHLFYCLHFPTAGATWCYDATVQMWHDRAHWNADTGLWSEDWGRYITAAWGTHIVSDFASGNIYEMSLAYADDDGSPLRWIRSAPYLNADNIRLFFSWFEVYLQVGGGLASGDIAQLMVRWTNDGGTWTNYRTVSCGATGQYTTRAITRRCGDGRLRAFEVSGSDPIPDLCIFGAGVGIAQGLS